MTNRTIMNIPHYNNPQDEGRNAPRINLEHVLSQGQVMAMEGEFKDLIEGTIARMDMAAREYDQEPDDTAMFERAQRSELQEQARQVVCPCPPCPYYTTNLTLILTPYLYASWRPSWNGICKSRRWRWRQSGRKRLGARRRGKHCAPRSPMRRPVRISK